MNESLKPPELSVVVPVFNEQENIAILQSELTTALAGIDHEIVFVDDGSTDQTAAKIEKTPRVRLIRFEQNRGQSAAIYAGAAAARGDAARQALPLQRKRARAGRAVGPAFPSGLGKA
jgi:glycosyltransferase involved in cell wall biosynthesis